MATYLAGITDNIRPIELFSPSWDFINSALTKLNTKQQAKLDYFSNLYYQIENADLTADENRAFLDQFKTQYKDNIRKIAQLDLTKSENIEYANSLFKPITENRDLMYDFWFTKKIKSELQYADPSSKSYNPISERALKYRLLEFKYSSPAERLTLTPFQYIPNINENEVLLKFFTDNKIAVQNIEKTSNGYIIKTQNGKDAILPFTNMSLLLYHADPRITEKYKQEAYTLRMGYLLSGDTNSAYESFKKYLTGFVEFASNERNQFNELINKTREERQEAADQIYSLANILQSDPSGLSIDVKKKIIDNVEELYMRHKIYDANLSKAMEAVKNFDDRLSIYEKYQAFKTGKFDFIAGDFDELYATTKMMNMARTFAQSYAMATKKEDIVFDEVYIARLNAEAKIRAAAISANARKTKNDEEEINDIVTSSQELKKADVQNVKDFVDKNTELFEINGNMVKPKIFITTRDIQSGSFEVIDARPNILNNFSALKVGTKNPVYIYSVGFEGDKPVIYKSYPTKNTEATVGTGALSTEYKYTENNFKLSFDNESEFNRVLNMLKQIKNVQQ